MSDGIKDGGAVIGTLAMIDWGPEAESSDHVRVTFKVPDGHRWAAGEYEIRERSPAMLKARGGE